MSLTAFLAYLQYEKNYSPLTLQSYEKDLQEFMEFYEVETGSAAIEKAEKLHLRAYIAKLSESNLSERTINRKISSLKTFYKYQLKIGEISVSPASNLKTLKHYPKVQIPFSEEELTHLFTQEEIFPEGWVGLRDRLMMELFYQTGMRRSELINLKDSSIDFSQKNLRVLGKRNKERIIPLSENLMHLLQEYMTMKHSSIEVVDDRLFVTEKGRAFYDKLVYELVNSYLSKVSTKHKKSPHMMRHSFATHLLDRGAELNAVKELLGHSSLAATQVYTHGSIEQLKKVFNQAHPRERKTREL